MLKGLKKIRLVSWKWFLLSAVLAAVLLALGIWAGWLAAAGLFLAFCGWGAAAFYHRALQQKTLEANQERLELQVIQQRLHESEKQRREEERRLKALRQMYRGLVEARDEHQLMEVALSALTDLLGAIGISFVPVDEWEQPLPPFTHGQLPEPVIRAWAFHLTSAMLRTRCAVCRNLEAPAGNCPLHPPEVGTTLRLFCLPLYTPVQANGKSSPAGQKEAAAGVLHVYLPPNRSLDNDTRLFLDSLLKDIALGYESARLRSQEMTTLRQLNMLNAPESDFASSLNGLLESIVQALETDFAMIRLRPARHDRISNLNIQCGNFGEMSQAEIDALADGAVREILSGEAAYSKPGSEPYWIALPMTLPEGRILGVMITGANHPLNFHPRQQGMLQTVASQAALLVENERMIRSLEYKAVIQERARLAREIHDGLAQTLAFLKLQAHQMQTYLAQGDTARLARVLKDNHQALTEAYLDTRQAIDNLRLTPQEGLETWLERTLVEFENSSGLHVQRDIQPLSVQAEQVVTPEVQAQMIRIVQEALSNVRKHSHAEHVWIRLREWKNEIILEVSDDGTGFDAEDVPELSRHGLRGMRERAELIGAEFQIISQSHQGTTVRLVLPASLQEETLQ